MTAETAIRVVEEAPPELEVAVARILDSVAAQRMGVSDGAPDGRPEGTVPGRLIYADADPMMEPTVACIRSIRAIGEDIWYDRPRELGRTALQDRRGPW